MHSLKRHASPSNARCCPPQHHHQVSYFLCLSLSQYLFPWFLYTSLFLLLSLCFTLFLYLLLEGDTPYAHTHLTLSEQLMLGTVRDRKRERKTKKQTKQIKEMEICIQPNQKKQAGESVLSSAHPHICI